MVQIFLDVLLGLALLLLWLPALSELGCLVRRRRAGAKPASAAVQRLLVLVPAHNEELMIGACVRSLVALDYPAGASEVIVLADNCTDRTAELARAAGARCLERTDTELRGKPRAIAWALSQMDLAAWDAVVVVDADTTADPRLGWQLSAVGDLRDVAVQSNIMASNEFENWLTRLGGVLNRCRYEVTYPLKSGAGLNIPLTGNGMAIGTGVLQRIGWNAFSIAEDSELYAQYTIAGVPILHAHQATVHSGEPSSLGAGATQRRRWLAGRLGILRDNAGALLRSRAIDWHQKVDLLVELALASPVLHLILALLLAAAGLLALPRSTGLVFAALALGSLGGIVAATVVVLWRHPEPGPTLVAFLRLPVYTVWRLALFAWTLVTLKDQRWVRSPRQQPTR